MKNKLFLCLSALILTFSILACGLPGAAQPTPAPTVAPPAGWQKFSATGVELWLPGSFQGGDLANDLDTIVSNLRALGPEFDKIADTIEANPNQFVLWTFDTKPSGSGFMTNMNVTQEKVLSIITLDSYMDLVEKQLPSSFTILERKNVQLGQYEAMRVRVEMNVSGTIGQELLYAIKNKNVIWNFTYAAGDGDYSYFEPIFEQSAQTIVFTE